MDELPEEEIEEAVAATDAAHAHDGVATDDGTLVEHLAGAHSLEVEPALSPATQQGLHDRLHGQPRAQDEPAPRSAADQPGTSATGQ